MGDYLQNFVTNHFGLNKNSTCFHKTVAKSSFMSMLH